MRHPSEFLVTNVWFTLRTYHGRQTRWKGYAVTSPNHEHSIGRRVREIRTWRRLSLRVVAELAGMSEGHLSNIERGTRRVDKRSTLEALANALHVAPSELAEQAFPSADKLTSDAHAGIAAVETALSDYELGESTDRAVRPWAQVQQQLNELNEKLRPKADYAAQGVVVPELIADLHTSYNDDPANRREALEGLMQVYHSAAVLTKNQGVKGLPQLAAFHAKRVAEQLEGPQWIGLAAWLKTFAVGSSGRPRQYEISQRAADELASDLDSPESQQIYGMLHLSAALGSAAQRKPDQARAHLEEASAVADRLPDDVNTFGLLYFGRTNVDIWRVALGTEMGDGGKVAEIARNVRPELIPSAARQAMFYADFGRALSVDKKTRLEAVRNLAKAESIAPQRIRTHPFVRETVADLMRRAKLDATGVELRGMAYRMGIPG